MNISHSSTACSTPWCWTESRPWRVQLGAYGALGWVSRSQRWACGYNPSGQRHGHAPHGPANLPTPNITAPRARFGACDAALSSVRANCTRTSFGWLRVPRPHDPVVYEASQIVVVLYDGINAHVYARHSDPAPCHLVVEEWRLVGSHPPLPPWLAGMTVDGSVL